MIRTDRTPALIVALPLVLAALAGCDADGVQVLPEIDRTFGFESGLESWTPLAAAGDGGSTTVAVSAAESSAGTSSLRIAIDDPTGDAAGGIVRLFELEPSRSYDVEVTFELLTGDGAAEAWSLVAGARPQSPALASLPVVGSTASSGAAGAFETRTVETTATTADDGSLFVALGVVQESAGTREYFVDEIRVVLTRR